MKPGTIILYCLALSAWPCRAQPNCEPMVRAFAPGEVLEYRVTYNWGLVWLESASARFTVQNGSHNGKACFYFRGQGSTHSGYDWFFKVRDVFETWTDTATLRPLKFAAQVSEGGKHDRHLYFFDDRQNRAYTIITRGKKNPRLDTLKQGRCTIDVLSAIYHARSYDYSRCRVNDTISMSQLIDGKVYAIYVRYLGKETFTTEKHGTFRCIKFSPLLVEGSIFKKGEGMTVWVTDDQNKLPLYIETPIIVGSIKVTLSSWSGLRFPETARAR
jgi:hypothetical protein